MKLLIKSFLSRIPHSCSQHNNTPHKRTYLLFKRMPIHVITTQTPFYLLNSYVPKLFKNQKERMPFRTIPRPDAQHCRSESEIKHNGNKSFSDTAQSPNK